MRISDCSSDVFSSDLETNAQGLQYGRDFDHLSSMPLVIKGKTYAGTEIHGSLDLKAIPFDGTIDSDARLCLQATAPRPCTILAAVLGMDTHDKAQIGRASGRERVCPYV